MKAKEFTEKHCTCYDYRKKKGNVTSLFQALRWGGGVCGGVMVRPLFAPFPPYESLEEATLRHGLLQY